MLGLHWPVPVGCCYLNRSAEVPGVSEYSEHATTERFAGVDSTNYSIARDAKGDSVSEIDFPSRWQTNPLLALRSSQHLGQTAMASDSADSSIAHDPKVDSVSEIDFPSQWQTNPLPALRSRPRLSSTSSTRAALRVGTARSPDNERAERTGALSNEAGSGRRRSFLSAIAGTFVGGYEHEAVSLAPVPARSAVDHSSWIDRTSSATGKAPSLHILDSSTSTCSKGVCLLLTETSARRRANEHDAAGVWNGADFGFVVSHGRIQCSLSTACTLFSVSPTFWGEVIVVLFFVCHRR